MVELSYTGIMLQKIQDEIEAPFRAEIDRLRNQRDVMRDALEQIESILVRGDKSASYMLITVRKALSGTEE